MMDMLTVVVIFLLKSYSVSAMSIPVGESISIPLSSNLMNPIEATKLVVTGYGDDQDGIISVDADHVMVLDKKTLRTLEKNARSRRYLIKDLFSKLQSKAAGFKELAKLSDKIKFSGEVLVIADKKTPYWLVTSVLFTAAEAGFDQYRLVAIRKNEQ